MKLRVAIVGVGDDWDSRHCPALRSLTDRFDIRVIYSQVAARAERIAREFDAHAVGGIRCAAMREDIDALLMFGRDWYGPLPIYAACDAGKAIYCASALEIEPQNAARLLELVEAAGIAFMAELPRRQSPATLRLKELIATRLGRPKLLFCHERLAPESKRERRPNPERSLIELVDWCRYIVDTQPVGVWGTARGGTDSAYRMISLEFAPPESTEDNGSASEGAVAQVSLGSYLQPSWHEARSFRPPADLQVCCENGVAFIDLPSTLVWFDEAGRHMESLDSDRPVGEQLLFQFHRAVTSLVRKPSGLDDVNEAIRIVTSAQEAATGGKRVSLD